jgi:tRNA G18 (ribose-2'-O)-methylase SpoU
VRILEGLGNTSAVIFTENTIFVQTHLVPGNRFTLSRQYGKTSVGTYKVLPTFKDTISNIGSLAKQYNYQIIVVDNIIDKNSIPLENLTLNSKTILVFGSENFGVSKQMLELKNQLVANVRVKKSTSRNSYGRYYSIFKCTNCCNHSCMALFVPHKKIIF